MKSKSSTSLKRWKEIDGRERGYCYLLSEIVKFSKKSEKKFSTAGAGVCSMVSKYNLLSLAEKYHLCGSDHRENDNDKLE